MEWTNLIMCQLREIQFFQDLFSVSSSIQIARPLSLTIGRIRMPSWPD